MKPGYYLFVGSDRPHKNLNAVAGTLRLMGDDTCFVVAGRVGDDGKKLFAGIEGKVRFIGQTMEKAEMESLYSGASALLFPSFHEGFGLPPLEAMASGTPVLAAQTSCLPEILGDAARYAQPGDAAAWAEAMHRIVTDRSLWSQLRAAGTRQARRYSWQKMARETLAIYTGLTRRPGL